MPKRIQRKRTKGWKMPPHTVYVGRSTKWGNPWGHGADRGYLAYQCADRKEAVAAYRSWITEGKPELSKEAIKELRGKDLACWCPPDQPCHANVLLEIANAGDNKLSRRNDVDVLRRALPCIRNSDRGERSIVYADVVALIERWEKMAEHEKAIIAAAENVIDHAKKLRDKFLKFGSRA